MRDRLVGGIAERYVPLTRALVAHLMREEEAFVPECGARLESAGVTTWYEDAASAVRTVTCARCRRTAAYRSLHHTIDTDGR
jgi:tRNA(Ile2) C34 agmatinyltransferase TiaS